VEGGGSLFIGFDAAIDSIYSITGRRTVSNSTQMETIGEFAALIAEGSGRSVNIGRTLRQVRAGGNAVLCAQAFSQCGGNVSLAANVGSPCNGVFQEITKRCRTISLGEPNQTDALEFRDGKILLTASRPLDELNYAAITAALPSLPTIWKDLDGIVLANWTQMPNGTEIFTEIFHRDLPMTSPETFFFFDIADPVRRSNDEIVQLLDLLAAYSKLRPTFLSCNVKEMERCSTLIGQDGQSYRMALEALHGHWPLEWVLHRQDGSDSFGRDGWTTADGFFTPKPLTNTGGGDTFNGGFLFAHCHGASRSTALLFGNALSGAFVRLGRVPTRQRLDTLLQRGADGLLYYL
jgi:hypothetical protein